MEITALSLRQPHASRVASGQKSIETRTWSTNYRGDLLICSSLYGKEGLRGMALCITELYEVRPMTLADEDAACVELFPNAQAWLLRNLRVLKEPFPVKGRLGLFKVEVDPVSIQPLYLQ